MDNKKQELLETAYRLIRTSGFDSFSYNDLSKAVNITKASIHYYFPNKEELGLAICDLIMQQMAALQAAIDKQPTALDKYDMFIRHIFNYSEAALICPISSLQAEFNVIPDSMKKKLKEITQKELSMAAAILQQGLDEHVFHFKGEALTQAILLITSIKSTTLYSRVLEQDLVVDVIEQFTRQLKT